jgi:NADH-quinone oxidoreductase subunit L
MTVPLAILAVLSLGGGTINIPVYLEHVFPAFEEPHDPLHMLIAGSAGILGIALAWYVYLLKPGMADAIAARFGPLYRGALNKFYVDEIYDAAVVTPLITGSRQGLWKVVDAGIIDGTVNGAGARAVGLGELLRRLQSGNIRSYATWVLCGAVLAIVAAGVLGGAK